MCADRRIGVEQEERCSRQCGRDGNVLRAQPSEQEERGGRQAAAPLAEFGTDPVSEKPIVVKDGRFGLWEGLGSCGFHTTDITYHASFGLTSLFPELQKRQMRMGAAFQREDGRVRDRDGARAGLGTAGSRARRV